MSKEQENPQVTVNFSTQFAPHPSSANFNLRVNGTVAVGLKGPNIILDFDYDTVEFPGNYTEKRDRGHHKLEIKVAEIEDIDLKEPSFFSRIFSRAKSYLSIRVKNRKSFNAIPEHQLPFNSESNEFRLGIADKDKQLAKDFLNTCLYLEGSVLLDTLLRD